MDELGRYYTNSEVSRLLVSCFQQLNPKTVLDLGVGEGALINAAKQRWDGAKFYVADVDKQSIANILLTLPFVEVLKIDGLDRKIDPENKMKIGKIDIAICNPPYRRIKKTPMILKLFREADLVDSQKLRTITSDIVFLAKNLTMLREGGELGIIVPDTIITGHEFELFREDLICRHCLFGVIQIPDGVFRKTEARTHILLIQKGGATPPEIPIYLADNLGVLGPVLRIPKKKLIRRMDFTYHEWRNNTNDKPGSFSLRELNVEIKRGRHSKSELLKMGIPYFHTSSFPELSGCNVKFGHGKANIGVVAKPGDILIARVGKRCIGKVTLVLSGNQTITDCVYRVRTPIEWRDLIKKALISKEGQNWMKSHAHGVCAKVLSKADLLSFRI